MAHDSLEVLAIGTCALDAVTLSLDRVLWPLPAKGSPHATTEALSVSKNPALSQRCQNVFAKQHFATCRLSVHDVSPSLPPCITLNKDLLL